MKMKLVLFVLYLAVNSVDSLYLEGLLQTREDWIFLARFCFSSNQGVLRFQIRYPVEYAPQNLLLYHDDQWPSVYQTNLNCSQKVDYLNAGSNQIVPLVPGPPFYCCSRQSNWVSCQCSFGFSSARERWWFLAVSHCDHPRGLYMDYTLWMTNHYYDPMFKEFSADEFYILQVDIAFLIIMTLLLVVSVIYAVKLHKQQYFHSTFKLYIASLSFQVFFLFIECIAYGMFSEDGRSNSALENFGYICEAIATLIFLLMLILMAKGFTITRGRLSVMGSIKIAIFMTLYTITYMVLFIYQGAAFDPGLVLYLYESPAGYGIITLRLIGWLWFCYATFFTLKHYPEKSSFYYPFFIYYTAWFWAGPIVILIANLAMPLHTREKVVNGVNQIIAFCGYAFFLVLTRPSALNKNFPYHVNTTQIGVMEAAPHIEDTYDTLTEDQHVDFTQLFVVSTTHSQMVRDEVSPGSALNSTQRSVVLRRDDNTQSAPSSNLTLNHSDTSPSLHSVVPSNDSDVANSKRDRNSNVAADNVNYPHLIAGVNPFIVISK